MSRVSTPVQTPAIDRTKGPVGFSGTVVDAVIITPRVAGDLVPLVITIICGPVRVHITRMFDDMRSARESHALVPVGSHLSAFGETVNLSMHDGELHLATDRVITYLLTTDPVRRYATA